MYTIKKFIQYYAPYKGVFFLDLVCAAGYKSWWIWHFQQILQYNDEDIIYRNTRENTACAITGRNCFADCISCADGL